MSRIIIEEEEALSNEYITRKMEEVYQEKQQKIIRILKQKYPTIPDDLLPAIYQDCISIHQSGIQHNGDVLEKLILSQLAGHDIPHRSQVTIDKKGMILGFNLKRSKCHHVLDIVVGDVQIGHPITEYTVLSCKTTCRERWTQDNWSLEMVPKQYFLITASSDYPSSERFQENERRMIISSSPKSSDDRIYPLSFSDLLGRLV